MISLILGECYQQQAKFIKTKMYGVRGGVSPTIKATVYKDVIKIMEECKDEKDNS